MISVKSILFAIILSVFISSDLQACEAVVGRSIIDKLINNQLRQAKVILNNHLKQSSDDPMNGFYEGTVLWAESGEGTDLKLSQKALLKLNKNLRATHTSLKKNINAPKTRLSKGMTQMLIARIHASRQEWIKAYRYGKAARHELQQLLTDYPDEKDVLLGLGLFEFYTGSVPPHLRWLTRLMRFSGDRQKGISMIQNAVRQSKILGPEAARVLLTEVIDNDRSQSCQYLSLAKDMRNKYRNNPQFSIASQVLLNNCGYPELALKENQDAIIQFSKYSKLVSELKLQRLHILSNLGKTEEINQFKGLSKNDSYHRELTLGKAHDVKNMRQKAIEYYTKAQKLAANIEGLDSNLSYLQKPYKKPSPKPLANAYSLSKGCG
jgi:tetratricopeptide (TPR) repeat protein